MAATVVELLRKGAATHGDHPAVVDGPTTIGFRELERVAHRVGRALLARGVAPGDRVALWSPNRWEYVAALLGAQCIGASVVPLNTRYKGHEAHQVLARSRASTLVVARGFLGLDHLAMLVAAGAELDPASDASWPGLPHLALVVDLNASSGDDDRRVLGWEELLAGADACDETVFGAALDAVGADTVADIMFTSGTTGLPKGVMSSHAQTVGAATTWADGARLMPSDRYAVVNPFFHSFGYKAGILASLSAGATVLPVDVFDAVSLMELVESRRVTVLPGPPTLFLGLLDHPRRPDFDLSSLRFATCGATAVAERLFEDMVHVLGFDEVKQAYGLTECVVVTMSRHGEPLEHVRGTTGPPVPGLEVRLGDRDEILVRGPLVMIGYFEDPDETARAIDAEGWLHTGDVGRIDEHGCLTIVDRIKDIVIVGGFNVSPVEVENVLARHPAVAESAVVGAPDERMGAVCHAHVVLRPGMAAEPDDLVAWLRERVANYKVPRVVTLVDELPRNAAGKVLKTALS
ncbi:AMP-binding protein [Nocardioides sp.]|uniref:AMP-binding protein n=1 Tax=Nocardioides sp. TaxID=35761 RepID=UPI0025F22B79|nr:AMP-binding protein [Nocardioides sp.]